MPGGEHPPGAPLQRHRGPPEPLLVARCQAANIEAYHDPVVRELDKAATNA